MKNYIEITSPEDEKLQLINLNNVVGIICAYYKSPGQANYTECIHLHTVSGKVFCDTSRSFFDWRTLLTDSQTQ